MLENHVLPQELQAHPLQLVQDALLEGKVIGASQWAGVLNEGDMRQDFQAITTRRGNGGIAT